MKTGNKMSKIRMKATGRPYITLFPLHGYFANVNVEYSK